MSHVVMIDLDNLYSYSAAFNYALDHNVAPTVTNKELMRRTMEAMCELLRASAIPVPPEMVAAFNLVKD